MSPNLRQPYTGQRRLADSPHPVVTLQFMLTEAAFHALCHVCMRQQAVHTHVLPVMLPAVFSANYLNKYGFT